MPSDSYDDPSSVCIILGHISNRKLSINDENEENQLFELTNRFKNNLISEVLKRKKFFIQFILKKRFLYGKKIQNFFSNFSLQVRVKKKLLIEKIIFERKKNAILIQKFYKMHLCRKHFKQLLQNEALFFYNFPFNSDNNKNWIPNESKKNNSVELQLTKPKGKVKLQYSKYLDQFYLSIKKAKVFRKKIKVNFIINGYKIIDSRYDVGNHSSGNFYNIIYSSMIYKKLKQRSPKVEFKNKKNHFSGWENFFSLTNASKHKCRKLSFETNSSISDQTDISRELNGNLNFQNNYISKIIGINGGKKKSILKKGDLHKNQTKSKVSTKKVSFNEMVYFCY